MLPSRCSARCPRLRTCPSGSTPRPSISSPARTGIAAADGGELTEDEFPPLRLQNGLYIQKHAPMLRIAIPYGVLASRQLRRIERGEIEVLQDVQHHQCGETLCIRGNLNEVDPAVISRNGRHRIAMMARKILRGEERAARGERRCDVGGNLAFIERARAFEGDRLQRLRQRRKADDVAFSGRRTAEQKMLGGADIGF